MNIPGLEQVHVTFSHEGNIKILLSIMRFMEKNSEIQKEISALLANLSGQETCRKVMQGMGVLKLMVRNLKNFVDDGKVETEICAVLANLATNDEIAGEIVKLEVVPILHKLMARTSGKMEHSDLIVQSFHLLTHMLRVDQLALNGYNFAGFICDCIPISFAVCEVATASCNLIGSLAYSKSQFYENERVLCKFIFEVMSYYPKDKILLITACFGIAHLINIYSKFVDVLH